MLTDALMLQIANGVARWFELAGIAAIVGGSLIAVVRAALDTAGAADRRQRLVPAFRRTLGRSILTGLELLVAADIIRTVAVEPTLDSVLVLGLVVIIRTFLSMSLEVEIDGVWPWRRAGMKKRAAPEGRPLIAFAASARRGAGTDVMSQQAQNSPSIWPLSSR